MELKPCPFCGEQPIKSPVFSFGYVGDRIRCNCGCQGPSNLLDEKAEAWWNNRPSGWVSVDIAVPKLSGDYECRYAKHYGDDIGRYNHSFFPWMRYWSDEVYTDRVVTHWMVLTEPPQPEDK